MPLDHVAARRARARAAPRRRLRRRRVRPHGGADRTRLRSAPATRLGVAPRRSGGPPAPERGPRRAARRGAAPPRSRLRRPRRLVELVDEWTGRVADNRRWPNGIQPAVEAKEGVAVQAGRAHPRLDPDAALRPPVSRKLAGMTATAESAADEFAAFFGLKTVVFPPHRTLRARRRARRRLHAPRRRRPRRSSTKSSASTRTGRPILVGTASVARVRGARRAR